MIIVKSIGIYIKTKKIAEFAKWNILNTEEGEIAEKQLLLTAFNLELKL